MTKQELKAVEELSGALKIIHTWAAFNDGMFFDRKDVLKICKETLSKTRVCIQNARWTSK
jgi:hypothetical protein